MSSAVTRLGINVWFLGRDEPIRKIKLGPRSSNTVGKDSAKNESAVLVVLVYRSTVPDAGTVAFKSSDYAAHWNHLVGFPPTHSKVYAIF